MGLRGVLRGVLCRWRRGLCTAMVAAVAIALASPAPALDYPSRPISLIVPFSAGGPVDTLARLLAEPMRLALGAPLVIENLAGASGGIAVARAARAAPDGYTAILGNWTSFVGTPAVSSNGFDVVADFEPVALLAFSPLMLVGRKGLPANDVRELIAWLKANPGKATAGTIGVGSPSQVGAIYFQKLTGTRLQLVPYRGAAPALTDLLAGEIDLRMAAEGSQMLPYLKTGAVKPFAIMATSRWAATPEIPTIAEAGVPELALTFWQALWTPKGTPRDIVGRLNAAAVAAVADGTVRARLAELGQEIPPREQQTPDALSVFHRAEIAKWWPIIKAADLKPE